MTKQNNLSHPQGNTATLGLEFVVVNLPGEQINN